MPITEEQEKNLDKNYDISVMIEDNKHYVSITDVYCYGQIDFSSNSEDCLDIDDFDVLRHLTPFKGITIPSRYNYNTHTCESPKPFYLWTETWRLSELLRYLHGCLNKPERVILFKQECYDKR